MNLLLSKTIEKKILENYIEYQSLFVEFQSKFLTGLYSRYKNLENGNLVLYYAREAHLGVLRRKDHDLNCNLSYERFWENYNEVELKRHSIIKIAEDTSLPKETARRKILQLTKNKMLNKKNKIVGWIPSEQYKEHYNLFIQEEIQDVSRLISFVCTKINFSISSELISNEIKEKFSFYWFHYLGAQLQYLKMWSIQIKDLEIVFIILQVANLFASKLKKKNLSHKNLFDNPSLLKEFISASISATSIADITGIPRATCVRKLQILVDLKIVSQDKISKRYYMVPSATSENLISSKMNKKVVTLFSNFFFICIRALNAKGTT